MRSLSERLTLEQWRARLLSSFCISRVRLQFVGDTDYGDWSSPDIYDHLSSTEQFGFDGTVDAIVAGSEIRRTLNGDLVYFNSETDKNAPGWYCRARDHVVTLRR